MVEIDQAVMRHSVQDVIRILENQPVRVDLFGQITAVQIMNRVSIAHLSIERALKFLNTRAGEPLTKDHHLANHLRELAQRKPDFADYLERAFHAAVRHYRYNPYVSKMGHLKSLQAYLDLVGSDRAFQDLRYWELHQSPDEALLRQLHLALHMELLRAMLQLLRSREPTETVASRVERAVKRAMWSPSALVANPGSKRDDSVSAYLEWRQGFASWSDALAEAVQHQFMIGDEFANNMVRKAYGTLLESTDLAVSYYAETLDVLPRQPRDAIPPVEWLRPPPHQMGFVNTPSGETLGEIERRWDGLWSVAPYQDGPVAVVARARSQTDARCYLAVLFSRLAEVAVNGEKRQLRIVASKETLLDWITDRAGDADDPPQADEALPLPVVFWDAEHGLKGDDRIRIKVRLGPERQTVDVLSGVVTQVKEHIVYLLGKRSVEVDEPDHG